MSNKSSKGSKGTGPGCSYGKGASGTPGIRRAPGTNTAFGGKMGSPKGGGGQGKGVGKK